MTWYILCWHWVWSALILMYCFLIWPVWKLCVCATMQTIQCSNYSTCIFFYFASFQTHTQILDLFAFWRIQYKLNYVGCWDDYTVQHSSCVQTAGILGHERKMEQNVMSEKNERVKACKKERRNEIVNAWKNERRQKKEIRNERVKEWKNESMKEWKKCVPQIEC